MPTYPIFHCRVCDSAVQIESSATRGMFPTQGFSKQLLLSCELDSDDFAKYCRGQGRFYANPPPSIYISPVGQNHFNYSGTFHGLCCYCALGEGLCPESFRDVGCYQCKRRALVVKEFSKLKDVVCHSSSWEANGWSGLSNSLIDYILGMLVGEKTKLVSD